MHNLVSARGFMLIFFTIKHEGDLVGERGFEPPTHTSRTCCATRLRYSPNAGASYCYPEKASIPFLTKIKLNSMSLCNASSTLIACFFDHKARAIISPLQANTNYSEH